MLYMNTQTTFLRTCRVSSHRVASPVEGKRIRYVDIIFQSQSKITAKRNHNWDIFTVRLFNFEFGLLQEHAGLNTILGIRIDGASIASLPDTLTHFGQPKTSCAVPQSNLHTLWMINWHFTGIIKGIKWNSKLRKRKTRTSGTTDSYERGHGIVCCWRAKRVWVRSLLLNWTELAVNPFLSFSSTTDTDTTCRKWRKK